MAFYILSFLAIICVLCPHEYAHAFVAYKNGDPTAKINGRMTLNPLRHFDAAGFACGVIVGVGWAKPVPIDPYNFTNYKKGMFTTAIAGITINYITAFIAYPLLLLINIIIDLPQVANSVALITVLGYLGIFLGLIFSYSLYSVVFNLLPLNPLDGFRVVQSFTRAINPVTRFLREYGQLILILLVVESFACDILANFYPFVSDFDILGYILFFANTIIGWPITALWEFIFSLV